MDTNLNGFKIKIMKMNSDKIRNFRIGLEFGLHFDPIKKIYLK